MSDNKPYSKVEEVPLSSISSEIYRSSNPEYTMFVNEVLLRLEQTSKNSAIRYTFGNKKDGDRFRQAVGRYAAKHLGKGHIRTRLCVQPDSDECRVYFWRGSEWKK